MSIVARANNPQVSVSFIQLGEAHVHVVVAVNGPVDAADAATLRTAINQGLIAARDARRDGFKSGFADLTRAEKDALIVELQK